MDNEKLQMRQVIAGLLQDVNQWRALLAISLKQAGGTIIVNRLSTDIEGEFEIVTRSISSEDSPEAVSLEIRLLEGKDEIEAVLGKPSPIIIPK